jgi:hypothetical protein
LIYVDGSGDRDCDHELDLHSRCRVQQARGVLGEVSRGCETSISTSTHTEMLVDLSNDFGIIFWHRTWHVQSAGRSDDSRDQTGDGNGGGEMHFEIFVGSVSELLIFSDKVILTQMAEVTEEFA